MKVLLVNGSPHKEGCTYTALAEVGAALNQSGIGTDVFWIGNKPLSGCIACKSCIQKNRCVFDDTVNEFLELAGDYDGFVFGTPVHWGGAAGAITSFLDRVFYADLNGGGNRFLLKPAAAVMSARRAGDHCHLGSDEQVFRPDADADHHFPVLEHGPRCKTGGCKAGCGGVTDHACPGPEHGMVPQM